METAVKTAELLMQKAVESKKDPYLTLLAWHNTASKDLVTSPAQRLFTWRTRPLLPATTTLLMPEVYGGLELP